MIPHINTFLRFASIWSVFLPACMGLLLFRRISKPVKIIWAMTVLAIIPQMVRYLTNSEEVKNFLYNGYILIEFFFAGAFFLSIMPNLKLAIKILSVLLSLFLTFYTYLCYTQGMANRFFSELVLAVNIFEFGFVLLFFYQAYAGGRNLFVKGEGLKYILLGMLLYTPTTLMVFAFWHYLHMRSSTSLINFRMVNNFFNALMYFLYAYGIWIDSKYSAAIIKK